MQLFPFNLIGNSSFNRKNDSSDDTSQSDLSGLEDLSDSFDDDDENSHYNHYFIEDDVFSNESLLDGYVNSIVVILVIIVASYLL
jgi:hypothetical protein